MTEVQITANRPRLRVYLAAGYVLFIAYVSLSPFSGWQELGFAFSEVLTAPLLQTYSAFDAAVNLLAYLPFGLLLGLALLVRSGAGWSVLLATLAGLGLSVTMEYAQMYLPSRTSSNMDILTNTIGTLSGAMLAVNIAPRAWFALHLARWRLHFLRRGGSTDFGLALVVLWMFAQINPSLPMLGNVFISEAAHQLFVLTPPEPFQWLECLAVTLNLLMLGALLLTLLRQRRDAVIALVLILCVVALVKFVAAAVLLKSWALLLWLNSEAVLGIIAGLVLLSAALWLSRHAALQMAVAVALGHVLIAFFVLDGNDPNSARAIYHWHYGHLLNYNGLSQLIALGFPFLLFIYLWRIREQ